MVTSGMCGATIFFPHYLINGTTFGGKKPQLLKQNVCFDFIYNFCLKHLTLRRIQQDIIINVQRYSRKVPLVLVRF